MNSWGYGAMILVMTLCSDYFTFFVCLFIDQLIQDDSDNFD
jgi:hypothetical protein